MATGKERMARLRQNRAIYGARQVTVWLDRESLARLEAVRQPGEHDSEVVRRALEGLAGEAAAQYAPKDWKREIRQVVDRLYRREIYPEVHALERLMTADRSQWAPTMIAGRAQRLRQGMTHLTAALKALRVLEPDAPTLVEPEEPAGPSVTSDTTAALHAEALAVYLTDIKPIVDTLEDLLHRDRWHISPSGLADHAVFLKRGLARLFQVFGLETRP